MYIKSIAAIFLLCANCCIAQVKQVNTDNNHNDYFHTASSWQMLLAQAKQANKLIFIDCYFTGCHPCALMDKQVFPLESVSSMLNTDFFPVKVDVLKEAIGDSIMRKYGITGFPTFLIIDAEGMLISIFDGYTDAPALISELENARQMHTAKQWYMGFSGELNVAYDQIYLELANRKTAAPSGEAMNAYLNNAVDPLEEKVAIAYLSYPKLDDVAAKRFQEHYVAFSNLFGSELATKQLVNIYRSRMSTAHQNGSSVASAESLIAEAGKVAGKRDAAVVKFLLGYHYFLGQQKDTTAFLMFAQQDAVLHASYMKSVYDKLYYARRLSTEQAMLFIQWAEQAIDTNAPLASLEWAATMEERQNRSAEATRYWKWAQQRATKAGMASALYDSKLGISQTE